MGSQRGGHQNMAQVNHEIGQRNGGNGCSCADHARSDELSGSGENQNGHGYGPYGRNAVFDREYPIGDSQRHIADEDRQSHMDTGQNF